MWVISSMSRGNMGGAAAAGGEGVAELAWWPPRLMRGTGPLERKSSIIQREVGKEGAGGEWGHRTRAAGWQAFRKYCIAAFRNALNYRESPHMLQRKGCRWERRCRMSEGGDVRTQQEILQRIHRGQEGVLMSSLKKLYTKQKCQESFWW